LQFYGSKTLYGGTVSITVQSGGTTVSWKGEHGRWYGAGQIDNRDPAYEDELTNLVKTTREVQEDWARKAQDREAHFAAELAASEVAAKRALRAVERLAAEDAPESVNR